MRSTPPRRPSHPDSDTRTSYQVGRPWMFEGKMLRGETGTPMRRMAFAKSSFAEAEPEPFTLANLTTKALTDSMRFVMRISRRFLLGRSAAVPRVGQIQEEFLHVPGAGRAALGAQAAVQAHVLVLDVLQGDLLVLPRNLVALVGRDRVVVAPLVDPHLLAREVHDRRRALPDVLAVEELVDRDRGVVAVRDRPDDVLRAEGRVAAEEDFRQRGLHRDLVHDRHPVFVELDAGVAL